jgi:hypothetical protein
MLTIEVEEEEEEEEEEGEEEGDTILDMSEVDKLLVEKFSMAVSRLSPSIKFGQMSAIVWSCSTPTSSKRLQIHHLRM